MDEKIRRLTNWFTGRKEPPFEIQINLTNKCNLNCLFCRPKEYIKVDEKDALPLDRWLELIQEAKNFGVKHWNILGGEPFSEPNKTIKIMEAIKKEEMFGIMSTNGTLITKELIEKMIESGWDELIFSIDSSHAETHDYLRGQKGVFERAVRTIKLIEEYKKIKNTDKPRLQLYFVITNKNYKEIPEFVNFAYSLNIGRIFFQAMIELNSLSNDLKLNKNELKDLLGYIKKAKIKATNKGMVTNLVDFLDCTLIENANRTDELIKNGTSIGIPCFEPWYIMQISHEGYASPCCNLNSKKVNIKNKSLQEIWYSSFFEGFRKQIMSGKLDKRCAVCCSGQILRNKMIKEEIKKCMKK